MADNLSSEKCSACRADALPVTPGEIAELKPQIPEWEIVTRENVPKLERTYAFPDFVSALQFTNRVGELAEEAGHHPDIATAWGKVTVTWWTHKIKNLHRNDFIMASRCDDAYKS